MLLQVHIAHDNKYINNSQTDNTPLEEAQMRVGGKFFELYKNLVSTGIIGVGFVNNVHHQKAYNYKLFEKIILAVKVQLQKSA